jgi:hypothetical protein
MLAWSVYVPCAVHFWQWQFVHLQAAGVSAQGCECTCLLATIALCTSARAAFR